MKEKIKIYLDTNIIYGFFLTKALEQKRKKEFKLPNVIKFLEENKTKFQYLISSITENELIRHFVTEFDIEASLIYNWIKEIEQLLEIHKININIPFEEISKDIKEIVSKTKIKKRVTNLEHLVITKRMGFYFLTGDEEIRKKCKWYYPKIINYKELRNIAKDLNNYKENNCYEKINIRELGKEFCGKEQRNLVKNSSKTRKNEKERTEKIQRNYGNSLLNFSRLEFLFRILLASVFSILIFISPIQARNFIIYNVSQPSQTYFVVNGTTGYVGIGLTNPSYPLHVIGDVYWSGTLRGGIVPWNLLSGYDLNVNWVGKLGWGNLTNYPSIITSIGSGLNASTQSLSGNIILGVNFTETQKRITGSCSGSKAIQVINADGTVTCVDINLYGNVTGSGTANYIPIWTSSSSLGNSVIYQSESNVGIGTTSPQAKLDVEGSIKADNFQTDVVSRIVPIYIRGTGLNNNANRVLKIGSTTIYDTGGRGLRFTVINKADHSIIYDATFDTYGYASESDNLANNITTRMNKNTIGILTSYDAWEGQLTSSLRDAFKRCGLTKALMTPTSPIRQPYAAIFECNTTTGSAKAVEVLVTNDVNERFAEIRGWLIDGSFIATGDVSNSLTDNLGRAVVFVNSAGNVGIGTTAPEGKLHVTGGSLRLDNNDIVFKADDTGDIVFLNADGSEKARIHAGVGAGANQLYFRTGGVTRLTIDTSGNVGIGTTSPTAKLHIADTGTIRLQGTYPQVAYLNSSGTEKMTTFYHPTYDAWIIKDSENAQDRVAVLRSGNVGIGTSSPLSKLGVVGGIIYVADTNTPFGAQLSGDDGGRAIFGSNLYVAADNTLRTFGTHSSYGYSGIEASWGVLKFYTNSGSTTKDAEVTPTVRMIINTAGNVGIGTASPSYKLDVAGDIRGQNNLYVSGNVGIGTTNPTTKLEVQGGSIKWGYSSLNLDQDGSIELGNSLSLGKTPYIDFHYGVGSDQDYNVRIQNDANGRLKLEASTVYITGNVGIGTASPSYRLDVRQALNSEGSQIAYIISNDNVIDSQDTGTTWEELNWTLEGFKFNSGSWTNLAGVRLYIKRSAKASINGWIRVRLYSDNAGVPGSWLATGTILYANRISTTGAWYYFGLRYGLSANTNYWIIIERSGLEADDIYLYSEPTISNHVYWDGANWISEAKSLRYVVYAYSSKGLYAYSFGSFHGDYGMGIHGYSYTSPGVYGASQSHWGVRGYSLNSWGGYFEGASGIYGASYSSVGTAVQGYNPGRSGYVFYGSQAYSLFTGEGLRLDMATATLSRVFYYDGAAFTNITTTACQSGGSAFTLLADTDDIMYFGLGDKFNQLQFDIDTAGAGLNLVWEYSVGNGVWNTLTLSSDETKNLTRDGTVTWTSPTDWATDTVNGFSAYWIRVRTTTTPTTAPTAFIACRSGFTGYLVRGYNAGQEKLRVDSQGRLYVAGQIYPGTTTEEDGIQTSRYIYDTGSAIGINTHFVPSANNTYDLGSSSNRWRNIYAVNIYGTFSPSGNVNMQGYSIYNANWVNATNVNISSNLLVSNIADSNNFIRIQLDAVNKNVIIRVG